MADWIAAGIAYILTTGLILLAFAGASKRGDDASDDLADRLLHGDIRCADAMSVPEHGVGS